MFQPVKNKITSIRQMWIIWIRNLLSFGRSCINPYTELYAVYLTSSWGYIIKSNDTLLSCHEIKSWVLDCGITLGSTTEENLYSTKYNGYSTCNFHGVSNAFNQRIIHISSWVCWTVIQPWLWATQLHHSFSLVSHLIVQYNIK